MTRDKINSVCSAIVTTLYEVDNAGAPSGVMYAALMNHVSCEEYQLILSLLRTSDVVTVSGWDVVKLTEKGQKLAKDIIAIKEGRQ